MPTKAVVFDVFGTLADLEQLAPLVPDVKLFFARTLRDAFALDAAGRFVPFKEVALSALRVLRVEDPDAVVARMPALEVRPDARAAFEHLRGKGLKVATLSNGAQSVTRAMLEKNGLEVSEVISIEEIRRWKPRREVYDHAASRMGVRPADLALIAAHAWDVHGAMQAGVKGVWVSNVEGIYAPAYGKPDLTADSLLSAAQQLG
jgi:2-haloacid dehalogenase